MMNYYVRVVQGKGLVSRLIEFKESEWPSHVELLECYSDDSPVRVLSSRYPAGVAIRRYDEYPIQKEQWFRHSIPEACQAAWRKLETIIGRKYDLVDIFGIGFAQDWHTDGRYICSEAVAWAFEKAVFPIFPPDVPVRRIMPSHFLLAWRLSLHKVVK
jgi:hypothetical protein